nr:RNA-directed DNA polymerase, eukaryota, reverse transcriptase zinc-binding domain protein [Tanacetum cinerariifolium]
MEAIRSKFFNGMEPSTKKITWAAWNKVLASKENEGLGVSSYRALNRALLLKWVWRFISQDGSLWFRVIKALYGTSIDSHPVNLSSNWCCIIRELHLLYDNWLGDKPLKDLFSRLFALELNKEVTVGDKVQGVVSSSSRRPVRAGSEYQHLTDINLLMESVSLSHSCDRWICDLSGDEEFRVKEVRNFLDNLFLPSYADAMRWVKYISIKINIFVWRARRDFLPTRVNISRRGLVDLPIGGCCFTWMNKAGTKFSKLDRFLISEDVIDLLPDIRITALDRIWSDHNLILLHVDKIEFGPSPFKLYNSWLLRDGFDDLIKTEWDSLDSNNSGFPVKCHEKFRILKDKIQQWNNNNMTMKRNRKAAALEELSSIEKKIDEGSASPSETENRFNLLYELEIIDKFASMDLIQKAQVKWDIEGDENTKKFHGVINRKRRNQMINGIMVEGNWITDPSLIKDAFFNFTKSNSKPKTPRLVTHEEIKEAVWDYVSSKAPGPNGFSFAFVKKYWDIIMKDLHDFINSFFASCNMPYGANSSFFTLIPKVNNPTLITDFRPISLIGIHYKIIAKILANRLFKVIDKIRSILRVFYLASGLKINIHKSNIYGIGVNEDEVYNMASNAGCIASNIPFNYLGLPIGSNMKSISSWKIAPESVLNDWERIRSNFFWESNQDSKKVAWAKWPIILNSYDNGGLNIGSLKAFNLAPLQKWRWRLFTSPNDLWVKVVKAFHGHEGCFDNNGCSFKGTWANIVGSSNFIQSKASEDTCVWNLGPNGTFTVKDARNIIDQKTLTSLPSTSWDKIIPRKVNIFMWRLSLDWLPHKLNLPLRGMDIPAISCSSCNANVESANHIFFECIIASDLWKLVYRGCEISFVQALYFEAFKDWLSSWHALKEKKHKLSIISTSRQFDFILDELAEVPSNDHVFGQWLNAVFQKAAFLSRLLPRGLFGVSSKTTSE